MHWRFFLLVNFKSGCSASTFIGILEINKHHGKQTNDGIADNDRPQMFANAIHHPYNGADKNNI